MTDDNLRDTLDDHDRKIRSHGTALQRTATVALEARSAAIRAEEVSADAKRTADEAMHLVQQLGHAAISAVGDAERRTQARLDELESHVGGKVDSMPAQLAASVSPSQSARARRAATTIALVILLVLQALQQAGVRWPWQQVHQDQREEIRR